ncbi:MAG: M28 family metallopeptidase [Bacteroidota bacterium]
MPKVFVRLILIFCSFHVFSAFSQSDRIKVFTKTLCSPEFHGRGYVKGGDSTASDYIAKAFKKIGLKPVGKSYFQSFVFPVQTFPGACTAILSGDSLKTGIDYLIAPNSGSSCATSECVEGKSYRFVSCNLEKLYDATTSFYPCPPNVMLAVKTFGLSSDSLKIIKNRLRELSSFAPVVEITKDKFTWSVSQSANSYPFIQIQDSVFQKRKGDSFFLHLQTNFIKQHQARNVIGYLPACKKPKKKPFIFITAHYDHLGRMGADTYFPGANDNASGNAMLLALAEKLVINPLRDYNIIFVAFAGEEVGLLGSKYMTENPIVPLNKIRFLLNLDIMGSGEEGITVVNSTLFKNEFDQLNSINDSSKFVSLIKPRGPAANSDHYFFTQAGVPAFFIYTMGPNKNYHDVFDTYNALSFKAFDGLSELFELFIRKL